MIWRAKGSLNMNTKELDRLISLGIDLQFTKHNKCPFCGPDNHCNNPQCLYRREYLGEPNGIDVNESRTKTSNSNSNRSKL